ncbi:hypothetical protein LTR53_017951, partial [Teratosphaeriaceae sp. CCFEE 6253]
MHQLLAPADAIPSVNGGIESRTTTMKERPTREASVFMKPSPKPRKPGVAALPPPPLAVEQSAGERVPAVDVVAAEGAQSQSQWHSHVPATVLQSDTQMTQPSPPPGEPRPANKRPAETEPAAEPAAKRGKVRKYAERPAWARLHPRNPRYRAGENGAGGRGQGVVKGVVKSQQPQHGAPNGTAQHHPPPQPQLHHQVSLPPPPPHSSGQGPSSPSKYLPPGFHPTKPWADPLPLDRDLLRTRACLGLEEGMKWEKSIRYHAPVPELGKQVMDFLYLQLLSLQDIPNGGGDGRGGGDGLTGEGEGEVEIEIEAKIGRIVKAESGERLSMPITTPAILAQGYATRERVRFESEMGGHEHQAMNDFLNAALQDSRAEQRHGRVALTYSHPHTRDSFRPLSDAGWTALPASFRAHCPRGGKADLKVRTTTNTSTHAVEARIVKLNIANLHILNP